MWNLKAENNISSQNDSLFNLAILGQLHLVSDSQ